MRVRYVNFEARINAPEEEGITQVEQLAIYCIITLSANPGEVTANLRGPICINTEDMQAKQLILVDERYHTKHSILEASRQEA